MSLMLFFSALTISPTALINLEVPFLNFTPKHELSSTQGNNAYLHGSFKMPQHYLSVVAMSDKQKIINLLLS